MSKKLERLGHEIRDGLTWGDPEFMKELAPMISALNKGDQDLFVPRVVDGRRLDFVMALEHATWKINWKYVAVHHAAHLGCVDIVEKMAGDLDSSRLPHCLAAAASNPSLGQLDTVRLLAPMVCAAKRPVSPAIQEALLTGRHADRNGWIKKERASASVLGELFRYERVDQFLKVAMKDDGPGRTAKALPYLAKFLDENLQNPGFVSDQASMRPAKHGPWSDALSKLSGECAGALLALQAACDAQMLEARVEQARSGDGILVTRRAARL